MQLLNSNGFRWHSIAHLSVCAIEKASTTGLPDTTKWFRHTHTLTMSNAISYMCVCVQEGYGVNLLSVTFSLWLRRQKKFYYSTGE